MQPLRHHHNTLKLVEFRTPNLYVLETNGGVQCKRRERLVRLNEVVPTQVYREESIGFGPYYRYVAIPKSEDPSRRCIATIPRSVLRNPGIIQPDN